MADKELTKTNTSRTFPACCDIYQDENQIVLNIEMPGVNKENLDIQVDNDKLIINGKRELPEINGKYLIREIRRGDYHLEYSIDDTIDRNKIEASIDSGRVSLSLGIKESEKPRKIKVEVK